MAPSDDRTAAARQRSDDDHDNISTYTVSDDGVSLSDTSERRRAIRHKKVVRAVALVVATAMSLCAGSNAVFSLYAPQFQSRLRYTQFQVNGVAIGSSVALYLPISVMGYACDRAGPAPLALLAALLFATGYGIAAAIYRKLDLDYNSLGKRPAAPGNEWSYPLMVFAFVCIGTATCAMYMSAVSTCAKNFGKGRYRGLALALPITAFGLSGMWISQCASRLWYILRPDGSKGGVDVFRFFVFLAVLLFSVGVLGFFTLKVVDEEDLIEEAIEELERSGLLRDRSLLRRAERGYGTNTPGTPASIENTSLLAGSFREDDDTKWKKNWVHNAETRRFLADKTMWPFALAFLLMVGPGEAFINNLGTIIGTLSPPAVDGFSSGTSAATHVSIFGLTSTAGRMLIGTITDLVAPAPQTQHVQQHNHRISRLQQFTTSRVAFMLFFAMAMSLGFAFLASGAAQNHADRFWVVSGLVGAGYGAVFSLAPIIVTIIWGVENFATNFGIVTTLPALGSTFWGLVYAAGYQTGASQPGLPSGPNSPVEDELFCYGKTCYSATFWGEAFTVWVACALLLWAWLGPGGWKQRGILI
ncbi:MFS monocarboxylic acid transporter [Cordyceps fumosorosea ARSEF 2679]|uniref:Probable transporter MCH1 n=1 Tax=Cordyceps fumosorosea (strain ARSEF 2679) TaxID=1081104 RepID=A0A162LFE9_CORFA|nr:MFS monocarboxylic acid transporter [Cordyceps fumosorosea ARSEF 2679]OAA69884.1 MFS monocarboxylic acid transporter [Cordyceps fumosorosea ARSEF 2679]